MYTFLKKIVPAALRHKMVRLLPAAIRHSLIDMYISKQMSIFEKKRQKFGDKWIESIPGWMNFSSNIGTNKTAELLSDYWRNVPDDNDNGPTCPTQQGIRWDIDWLKGQVDRLLPNKGTILEFGCGAGRVLRCFVEDGYQGVGVEINPEAVEVGKKVYPSLQEAKYFIGDGPESLKKIDAKSVDLIYSTAVLRHVAPEKIDAVIAQFSRIGPKYIITVEDEASLSYRSFPHNYRSKFSSNKWREVLTQYAIDVWSDIGDTGGLGTMLRIYTR